MINRKLHTRDRLVPKSMTLDDLEQPFLIRLENTYDFGAKHVNFNEDRPILSATKVQHNDSNFWQYKVCVDIPGVSWRRVVCMVIENVDFHGFRTLCLRHLRN